MNDVGPRYLSDLLPISGASVLLIIILRLTVIELMMLQRLDCGMCSRSVILDRLETINSFKSKLKTYLFRQPYFNKNNTWHAKHPYSQSETELLRARLNEIGPKELCCRLGARPLNTTHV